MTRYKSAPAIVPFTKIFDGYFALSKATSKLAVLADGKTSMVLDNAAYSNPPMDMNTYL